MYSDQKRERDVTRVTMAILVNDVFTRCHTINVQSTTTRVHALRACSIKQRGSIKPAVGSSVSRVYPTTEINIIFPPLRARAKLLSRAIPSCTIASCVYPSHIYNCMMYVHETHDCISICGILLYLSRFAVFHYDDTHQSLRPVFSLKSTK